MQKYLLSTKTIFRKNRSDDFGSPDRILAVTSFTPIVIVDESIDSTTQKDRCSCNSKKYVIWAHNEFFNVTRNLRIDL